MPQKLYYNTEASPAAYKKGGKVKAMDDDDCDYKAKGGKVKTYAKGGKTAYAKGGPVGTKIAKPAGKMLEKKKGGMC